MLTNTTGTMCFVNAVLYALSAVPTVLAALSRDGSARAMRIRDVLTVVPSSHDASESRDALLRALGVNVNGPGDPHEFLTTLVTHVMDTPALATALRAEIATRIKCGHCHANVYRRDPGVVFVLRVTTQTRPRISDLWDAEFAPTRIRGWRCESCGVASDQSRHVSGVARTPSVLFACVSRTNADGRKSSVPVSIDREMYVHGAAYAFKAAVVHSGATADDGHYVAITPRFVFDDHRASGWTPIERRDGSIAIDPPRGTHVYLCLYERVHEPQPFL